MRVGLRLRGSGCCASTPEVLLEVRDDEGNGTAAGFAEVQRVAEEHANAPEAEDAQEEGALLAQARTWTRQRSWLRCETGM